MSRVLILGSEGQLGISLSNEMRLRNTDFKAFSKADCDIADFHQVERVISDSDCTSVVNCAAWTQVDEAEVNEGLATQVNGLAVGNIARICNKLQLHLTHISTDYVFDGSSSAPMSVKHPPNPINAYGRSKLVGEILIQQEFGLKYCIVRTAWLYSRHRRNFASIMVERAKAGVESHVVDDQHGQPTSAQDLAKLLWSVATGPATPPIIHGTNAGITSWFEFAQAIYGFCGQEQGMVHPVTSSQYPAQARRPAYSVLAHDWEFTENLRPLRDWREALQDEVQYVIDDSHAP